MNNIVQTDLQPELGYKMKGIFIIGLMYLLLLTVDAQEVTTLYPGQVPNSKPSDIKEEYTSGMYKGVTVPTLEIYLPEKDIATGSAVVICPGGGYLVIVYQGEGVATAKEFAKNGVAAFVLKYRLPDDKIMLDKTIGPLQDAQQAIKIVRENSDKWGIIPNKIGIIGFSAGGHLAATAATHFQTSYIENTNNTNLRPDFQILVYPVISMLDNLTHTGSKIQLLGENASKETIELFSNELQVNSTTPPAYITHAGDDQLVDVDNSIFYFEKLRQNKVPVEMHIYQAGGHGFIFDRKEWSEPVIQWIKEFNWITNK